jgi:single-strand DNA-binding protein
MPSYFGLAKLGRDAELRYTNTGEPVANLALAFTYGRKGDDGKRPTQWVDATIWGKRAEAMSPYLTKGTSVSVIVEEAHIETYKKRDGSEGFKLVGRVSALDFAGSPQTGAPAEKPAPKPAPAESGGSLADMDSDIPF